MDPFTLGGKCSFPGVVEASDLVSYLVLQTSFVTAKQFKAHKYLEAYNQSTSGWVKVLDLGRCHERLLLQER